MFYDCKVNIELISPTITTDVSLLNNHFEVSTPCLVVPKYF